MIVSGESVKERVSKGEVVIKPVEDNQFQPASVDMRLGNEFLVVDENNVGSIDLNSEARYKEIQSNEFYVPPKSFVLAKTKEYIEIPLDCSAFVEGRSSIGRLGLFIQNAGWIDPGFKGTITLELFNACNVPIKLESNRRICQLVFVKMDKTLDEGYKGKYLGQVKVTGSRVFKDEDRV